MRIVKYKMSAVRHKCESLNINVNRNRLTFIENINPE